MRMVIDRRTRSHGGVQSRRQIAVQKGLQANDLDKRLLDKLKESKTNVSLRELK